MIQQQQQAFIVDVCSIVAPPLQQYYQLVSKQQYNSIAYHGDMKVTSWSHTNSHLNYQYAHYIVQRKLKCVMTIYYYEKEKNYVTTTSTVLVLLDVCIAIITKNYEYIYIYIYIIYTTHNTQIFILFFDYIIVRMLNFA